jgi:hypothetical protein
MPESHRTPQGSPAAVIEAVCVQHREVQSRAEHIGESGLARSGSPTYENGQRRSVMHEPRYRGLIVVPSLTAAWKTVFTS